MLFFVVFFIVVLQSFVMYVSNARGDKEQGKAYAYDRQFVKLNMRELFKVPRPLV